MICIPIIDGNIDSCLNIIEKADLVEIRFDKVKFNDDEISKLFSYKKLIATYRPGEINDEERLRILKKAIQAGAKYVDIEIESNKEYRLELINYARKYNCDIIISYHNFEFTPLETELKNILSECFELGADVAKIATMVNDISDNARLLSLYNLKKRMVILGMGELGKITRIASLFLGAEFTFASFDDKRSSAPGQIPYENLLKIISLIKNT